MHCTIYAHWRLPLKIKKFLVVTGYLLLAFLCCFSACSLVTKGFGALNNTAETLRPSLFELNERLRQAYFSSSQYLTEQATNGSSFCAIDHGCPYSSMVWASGTFTISELLTPSSFLVASNLTLKISLCCGYKYNGALLRDEDLYDMFLHVLLQASPFQVLSKEEKRNMFPRKRVVIIDTVNQRRYDAAHVPTEEDVQRGNDGDGDVIVLFSGAVGDAVRHLPLYHTTERLSTAMPADIQLKIANVALKCKCPHTLLVMPVLQVRPDTLTPVSIIGVGPHCGKRAVSPSATASYGNVPNNVVQLRDNEWAVSFAVSPPLLPATLVHWVVTDKSSSKVVLDESFYTFLEVDSTGVLQLQHANCSYFKVLPHHTYEVLVTVLRGESTERSVGSFVMRMPVSRDWEVQVMAPQLHFGFERRLKVFEQTLFSSELRSALLPRHGDMADYFGYWENTPLDDQPLPQTLQRVQHDPFTEKTVLYPLFFGRNKVSFYVSDIDEVCYPVLFEEHEFWAFQSILLQPSTSPTTVCSDDIWVKAFTVRPVLAAMRLFYHLPVRFVGDPLWVSPQGLDGVEGRFECVERGPRPAACSVTAGGDLDGPGGVLQMRGRGVAQLSWVLQLEVGDGALVAPESIDPAVARIATRRPALRGDSNDAGGVGDGGAVVVVEVHSRPAVVVRRILTLPDNVNVTLPMSVRLLKVHPPRSQDGAEEEVPHGRWIVSTPLRLVSVNDMFVAEVDTSRVPNVHQTLRAGTLQFMAEDSGEAIDIGVPYTSRCPPRLVEHVVTVVPVAAAPIVPATVVVYTEAECVRVRAPRGHLKDEETHWHIPYCEGATKSLYIMEEERKELNLRDGEERGLHVIAEEVNVCGIEVYRWCDIIWTASNLIGTVTQTFSLRRCQCPPQLLLHKDGLQMSHGIPGAVYAMPTVRWLVRHDGNEYGNKSNSDDVIVNQENESLSTFHYITSSVIPIAGHSATIGYSFNYTGSQHDFEVNITDMHLAVSQLGVTQQHFEHLIAEEESVESAAETIVAPLCLNRFFPFNKYSVGCYNDSGQKPNLGINDTSISCGESAASIANSWSSRSLNDAFGHNKTTNVDIDTHISLTNIAEFRKIRFLGLAESSHYPFFLNVGASPNAPNLKRDAAEFAKRGMCLMRQSYFSIFSLAPRGVVSLVAGDVLLFCYSSYNFSRPLWLHTKYHFDFFWSCGDERVISVERYGPTFSMLHHSGRENETRCSLTVRNTLTETEQMDSFLLRRVHPRTLPQSFVVLSNNVAEKNYLLSGKCTPTVRGDTASSAVSNCDINFGARQKSGTRWIVGKTVILHVEAAVKADSSQWRAISVVPETVSQLGSRVLLDSIHFSPLVQYTRATALGLDGATALVTGINVPGLYTFAFYHPDPMYPGTCPNVSLVETFHVVHAQVVEKELTVCDDSIVVEAVPLPREVECEFVGQWEVLSVQTSANRTTTDSITLAGIHFENASNSSTLVRGLPFGIVTIRWAIYALPLDNPEECGSGDREYFRQGRVLVDFDTMKLLVLTENIQSDRIVTLSDTVRIYTTSSTLSWALKESGTSSGSLLSRGPQLRVETDSKSPKRSAGDSYDAEVHEVIVVSRLPIGLTYLEYDLYSSSRLFGPMLSKKQQNVLKKLFVIERVSAFLSVNTTLDHECDAYSGNGRLSICLHAEGARNVVAESSSLSSSQSSLSLLGARLVAPENFEAAVKAGAERLAAARGCSLPWWVDRTTRWFDIHADAARHCVSFGVAATRHMQPAEVSHFLFLAQGRLGSSHLCSNGGDFMTSEIIEGALTWSESATVAHESTFLSDGILQFLPFLNFATLTRDERSMRPMLSLLGVPDTVAPELEISDGDDGVFVVLRLDTAQPQHMGGFVYAASPLRDSLLAMCVRGTVRGSDVLQFWAEVNRPDGADGQTAKEWLDYVEAVKDKNVPCEPLFASFAHMLLRPDDTDTTLRSRRAQRVPPKEQRLVSIDVVEQQLVGLQRDFRWTREGIDVTGLRAELQDALLRRRITKSQLEEIEEVRSLRKMTQKEKEQQQHSLLTRDTGENLTREENFENVLRLYKGVIGEDVAAIRLKLPRYKSFSVPHNLFLRTAVHKDVLCGANISSVGSVDSLVLFGRLELVDVPPVIGVTPAVIKQCEVEGGIPVINVNVSGVSFVHVDFFPTANVLLEEIPHPNRTVPVDLSADVGLTPCMQQIQNGMRVDISPVTRKQLELKLSPCPSFQMLSQADYNEHQNSELLLEKLLFPRLLRVTLRNVLMEDSHTRGMSSVSFLLEVRPTLARLHLRPLLSEELVKQSPAAVSLWLEPVSRRPLLMCEADVRRHGVELGIELIGDQWHLMVGEEDINDNGNYHSDDDNIYVDNLVHGSLMMQQPQKSTSSDSGNGGDSVVFSSKLLVNNKKSFHDIFDTFTTRVGGRKRTPQNVALMNSFSIVEHYSFDSAHHLLLRHGGLYRSHFLSYLFLVMSNRKNILGHKFIHRYNDTFVGVRIPPERRGFVDGFLFADEDGTSSDAGHLPPIRPFSNIEEIIFAVPGIATECRGCLLADTTYFVAGDLTGLWSFPPNTPPSELNNDMLVEPLRVSFYAAPHVPREWRFTSLCPAAAWDHLTGFWGRWKPLLAPRNAQPFMQMELVVYSLRDMLGGEVPLSKRPTVLLVSAPLLFGEVLKGDTYKSLHNITEIVFMVNDSAAERAQAMMAADFARYKRRHMHTTHDYIQDDRGAEGALAVNASVFLSVCVPPTAFFAKTQCSIVSFTTSLLIMEEPHMSSYYRRMRSGSLGSFFDVAALVHHAGSALVLYVILMQLSAMRRVTIIGNTRFSSTTRGGLTAVLFVAMLFFYRMAPRLWAVVWTLLWATLFSLVPDVLVGVYCMLHFLFWAFVM